MLYIYQYDNQFEVTDMVNNGKLVDVSTSIDDINKVVNELLEQGLTPTYVCIYHNDDAATFCIAPYMVELPGYRRSLTYYDPLMNNNLNNRIAALRALGYTDASPINWENI